MFNALFLSIGQLFDRRILILLLKVFVLTLLLLAVLGTGTYFLLVWIFSFALPENGGLAAAATAVVISLLAAVFLFRVIAIFVLNIFSDDVVDAVGTKHYPARAESAKPPSYALGLKMGLRSALRALGYNLLAAPIYIMLAVTGVGTAIAFFVVNGLLIGRDLQDMVASRHVSDVSQIDSDWLLPKMTRFGLGIITALLLAVPVVNFLAPLLGAAMATHLIHSRREAGQ